MVTEADIATLLEAVRHNSEVSEAAWEVIVALANDHLRQRRQIAELTSCLHELVVALQQLGPHVEPASAVPSDRPN